MARRNAHRSLRIGLTGGIASGKSTVAELFAERGVAIIDTDVIARELVEPGQPALAAIRRRFGNDVIDDVGRLDRSAMRRLVFSAHRERRDLEAILHPLIGDETRRQAELAIGPYQLIVVPLLVDSPLMAFIDRVLLVDCDEELQVQRLLARDTETIEQAQRILASQASRESRLSIADDVIENSGDLRALRRRVRDYDRRYRQLADCR